MPIVPSSPTSSRLTAQAQMSGRKAKSHVPGNAAPAFQPASSGCSAPDERIPQGQVTVAHDLADQHAQRVILLEVVAVHDRTTEGCGNDRHPGGDGAQEGDGDAGRLRGAGARPLSTSAERYRAAVATAGTLGAAGPRRLVVAALLATYTSAVRSWPLMRSRS